MMEVVKSKKPTERMMALVVGSTGYVKGNESALANVIGLTKAESTKYANRWLSFPTSNQGLGELVGGLLASQVAQELEIGGPYTYGKSATVGGQKATATPELTAYMVVRPGPGSTDWSTKVGNFLLDRLSEANFLAAAASSDANTDRDQHCEAWYYAVMARVPGGPPRRGPRMAVRDYRAF